MKRIIKKLISIFLLLLLIISILFIGIGYVNYVKAIDDVSIADKVAEIRKRPHYVTFDKINENLFTATVAIEDRRFYEHHGVEYRSMLRAAVTNVFAHGIVGGGSTITQQLAKNLCLSFKKNLSRKFAEVFIAKDLEDHYSKDEILEMYLNITYLGEGNYGIQAASQYYYHIDAIDLNKQQCDILVKTLKRPSVYNPSKVN